MSITTRFIELFQRKERSFDKSLSIHKNGVDNNYPEFVERLIEESVTASQCSDLMSDYVSGRGFGDAFNNLIINSEKLITGMAFVNQLAESWTNHKGIFIHVNYNANYDIIDPSVLPFTDCRIGKKDDNDYAGKILICDDWGDLSKAKNAKAIDVYNPRPEVIQAQIEAAGGIDKYKGQVMYIKDTQKLYPLSRIHPVLKDTDSEAQVSIYKNTSLRKGFFGKTLIVTKPLVQSPEGTEEYRLELSERDKFRETVEQFIGAENADGVMHMEVEFQSDDISKEIHFQNIESNLDDKLFAHTESSVSENIRMCFKNPPPALVKAREGGIYGDNILQAKIFYQDQTHNDRMKIQEVVRTIMSKYKEPMNDLTIIPLIDVDRQAGNS